MRNDENDENDEKWLDKEKDWKLNNISWVFGGSNLTACLDLLA